MRHIWATVLLTMGSAVVPISGCHKPLFPAGTPRSPYERYLTLRGQVRPAQEINRIDNRHQALRDRLRPLEK